MFNPRRFPLIPILTIMLASLINAQQPRDISAKDLISFPSIRQLEFDPQNNRIFYELRETDIKKNTYRHHLWVMNVDGGQNRQFTYSAADEWSPRVSPTGAFVAFLSDRLDANSKGGSRIWVMPVEGGEAKPLSPTEREIIEFKWSADATRIYYLTSALKPQQTKDWITQREKAGYDAIDRNEIKPAIELWVVDKSDGINKRLFVGDPGVSSFDIDSKDEVMVYSTNYTGDGNDWVETDLFLFSILDSTQSVQLTSFKGAEEAPLFSPDGGTVAYMRPQDHRKAFSQQEIEIIDLSNQKVKRLTADLDRTISQFTWYTNNALLLEVLSGMNNHLYIASRDGSLSAVSGGSGYFFHSSVSTQAPQIAAVRQTSTGLGEIMLTKGPGHPWEQISNLSTALNDIVIHPQTSFLWMSRDERFKLQGLVVLPHFSGDDPLPLIVDIHGGPAARTDIALEQFAMYQAWASQGFAVFSPNFRGSEGYNAEFQVANYRDLGGGDYHDIMSGVKNLIKRGVAHPDSLVIMGGSYGGYMTNWAITQTKMFKAAVSRYGIYDLRNDFSNSIYAQWELDYLGKTYWEDPSLYRRMSPSTFIKKAQTPTLILHGADDENTFKTNSFELARALKTLGVPHQFFLYPREGHGMGEPNHQLDVFQRQLSWVNHHLGRTQALDGEDWLSKTIRVQILSVNPSAQYKNQGDEKFMQVKILLDGSHLVATHELELSDITLQPDGSHAVGLPSGEFLASASDITIEISPESPTTMIDLVFPYSQASQPVLNIRGLGEYALKSHIIRGSK